MDKWGYPDTAELALITAWPPNDLHGLMEFAHDLWHWKDLGWTQDGEVYCVSTGGWSGNEDLIEAMQANEVWWTQFYQSWRRGGHFVFHRQAGLGEGIDRGADGG